MASDIDDVVRVEGEVHGKVVVVGGKVVVVVELGLLFCSVPENSLSSPSFGHGGLPIPVAAALANGLTLTGLSFSELQGEPEVPVVPAEANAFPSTAPNCSEQTRARNCFATSNSNRRCPNFFNGIASRSSSVSDKRTSPLIA
jgi:hypothetical protein